MLRASAGSLSYSAIRSMWTVPGGDGGGGGAGDADGDADGDGDGSDGGGARRPMLAAALSLALCYANRRQTSDATVKPRVLVLQATPDAPA